MREITKLSFLAAFVLTGCTVTTSPLGDGGLTDLDGSIINTPDSGSTGDGGGGTGDGGGQGDGGGKTDAGGDGGATCSVLSRIDFGGPICNGCVATHCCAPVTNCFTLGSDGGTSECEDLFDCIQACDPDAGDCVNACQTTYPNAQATATAVDTCISTNCDTDCQ